MIFTDPEVASVGLTEAAAVAAGHTVRTVDCALESVAAAPIWVEGLTGRCQLVVEEGREVIIGATFVGSDTAELLHSATVAMAGEVPMSRLYHAVAAFPTLSEVWLEFLDSYAAAALGAFLHHAARPARRRAVRCTARPPVRYALFVFLVHRGGSTDRRCVHRRATADGRHPPLQRRRVRITG